MNPKQDFSPLEVKVQNNNFDQALKKFRVLVQKEGILLEFKERMHAEKPSAKRNRLKRVSKNRMKYEQKK